MPEPKRVSDDLAVTVQPTPADIRRFAELGYRTIINNRPDGEEPGQLSAAEARAEAERAGFAYVHLPVKLGSIGSSDVEAFQRALRENPQPAVARLQDRHPFVPSVGRGGSAPRSARIALMWSGRRRLLAMT